MFPRQSVYVTSMLMKERDLNTLIIGGSIAQVAEIQAPLRRSAKCSSQFICHTVGMLPF